MPGRGRPLRATRSSSQPSSRTSSPDHRASLIVVQGSDSQVQDAVRAVESEVTIMEEMVQRMTELIAQNREELLRRMEEMARTSEDRLQRLEDHLQGRTAPTEAVVSRSNGSQVPSAVQPEEPPADAPLPHNRQGASPPATRSSSPIHHVATREDLQEWQQQLEERERRLQRQERALQNQQLPGYRREEEAQPGLSYVRTAMSQQRITFDQQPSLISRDVIPYLVSRDSIPHFKGETSACEPLKRNQEVESYIRAIENLVRPATDDAYIRAARASCRGRAETIINSESFDGIQDWDTFKRQLRRKFRGTYSASDFFKVLYDHGMTERQAPMDFFLEVEASVFQGYRDHRGAVGEPSELIRRVFLAGLPSTLRDLLVLKDDCSPIQLAETARSFGTPGMASGTAVPTLATSLRTTSKRTTTSFDVALQTGHLVLETVMTCSLLPPHRHLLSLFPRLQYHGVMYGVNIIEVQPTAPGNAELLPVSLHHQPTLVSVVEGAVTCLVSAPFREARKEGFPTSLATLQEGTRTRSITVQTEPVQTTAAVTTPAVGGRPVVALSVDGKTLLCFIDTGSQVTLVKPSALEVIDPAKKLRHYASSKILQGVSGEPFHPAAEVTLSFNIKRSCATSPPIVADLSFHGDVLLGTDFLRRQDFHFADGSPITSWTAHPGRLVPDSGLSHLWERSTVFPSPRAITNSCNQPSGTQLPGIMYLLSGLALRTNSTSLREERQNPGGAAAGRDRCPVSSGCTLPRGLGSSTSATTEHRFLLQAEEESAFTTASAVTELKHFTKSLSLDGSVEEMEWDDFCRLT
ncbi:hypothetical protein C7M84_024207 [Penaeus vannamei]|uniref:Peptidase A2 domain-containing protein n=1 Tax=Penaeus vannamei TaxID=6689 RepID=A0A423U1Q4_PENVA|nr:hypothetical protein C7M84_024207 [Penaeus vannamei]